MRFQGIKEEDEGEDDESHAPNDLLGSLGLDISHPAFS
jgi:hypothetical protein